MSDDFGYGNARLRAMKAHLFDARHYQELLAKDLDGLIGSLAQTVYKPDVDAALVRFRGVQVVYEAVRTHLARTLRRVAGFYQGRPRQQVDLLLARWDRRNLLTVLRSQALPPLRRPEEPTALLVPAGALDEAALAELLRQPDLRSTVDLLVSWLPDAAMAHSLLDAWPTYAQTGNLAVLEHALNSAYARWLDAQVQCAQPIGDGQGWLRRVLCAEIEQANLLISLRLRQARLVGQHGWEAAVQGETDETPFLPCGRIKPGLLADIVSCETAAEVVGLLARVPGLSAWQPALAEWQETDDLLALERNLERALTRQAIDLFVVGDPLSVAVPIAFVWAKENEARNLRLLAQGLAHQMPPDEIRQTLFLWPASS
ncbi:MAG: V-type ATPase subunit [Caldilineales bacterium]|nr:V-type ATPase subunit [Caldilineales bacterium]MDW8317069.1 V-type ATPase subunit [Anaerolineae bacterium]